MSACGVCISIALTEGGGVWTGGGEGEHNVSMLSQAQQKALLRKYSGSQRNFSRPWSGFWCRRRQRRSRLHFASLSTLPPPTSHLLSSFFCCCWAAHLRSRSFHYHNHLFPPLVVVFIKLFYLHVFSVKVSRSFSPCSKAIGGLFFWFQGLHICTGAGACIVSEYQVYLCALYLYVHWISSYLGACVNATPSLFLDILRAIKTPSGQVKTETSVQLNLCSHKAGVYDQNSHGGDGACYFFE